MAPIYLFSIRGIPVFVSVWFFLLLGWFSYRMGDVASMLLFGSAVTVSLLVHEFGHATVARFYRLNPKVLLHGWGGLCAHDRARRDLHDAFIVAAGPGAGLALGTLSLGVSVMLAEVAPQLLVPGHRVGEMLTYLVWINFVWSFFNLLPLWPLDGGQLFRLGVIRLVKPLYAERIVHSVGLGLAAVGVILAFTWWGSIFMAIISALLGWENLRRIRSYQASGPIRRRDTVTPALLESARAALDAGNYREAARLGHQARSERGMSDKLDAQAWEVIALGTFRQGKHDEGLRFARHAPDTPAVVAARLDALIALGRLGEAEEIVDSPLFAKLPAGDQAAVRQQLAEAS